MAGSYIPLEMPTLGADADFAAVAEYVSDVAERVNNAAQSFVSELHDLNAIDYASVGNLPQFLSAVLFGSITGVGDRPARPSLSIANLSGLLQQLENITPPDAPADEFTYTDPGYGSILRDPLMQKLLVDLVQGGYGIETSDELNLWMRARDREAQTYAANIEEIDRQAASANFPMPQGSLAAARAKAAQEYASKVSSINRDIALKRSELYVQSRQFTIEKVLASEDQSIALYNAVQSRQLIAAQAEVQMALALFDGGIRATQMERDTIIKQIETKLQLNQEKLSLYATDVSAYAAYVNAVAAAADLDIRNSRNLLDSNIANHNSRVEIIRFKLQQLALTTELRKEIAKFGTEFFRTSLGTAINGINGLAVQSGEV